MGTLLRTANVLFVWTPRFRLSCGRSNRVPPIISEGHRLTKELSWQISPFDLTN